MNEQQTNQEQQQNSNTEGNKTFTQDEVNRIVSDRLNKEKGKINSDRETEYSKREADLNMREIKIKARESLSEKALPKELGDILNCSSEDELNKCIEILERHYSNKGKEEKQEELRPGFVSIGGPGQGSRYRSEVDPIKEAMGLKS